MEVVRGLALRGRDGLMSGLDSAGEGGALGRGVVAGEMCMCETGEEASDWLWGDSWNFLVGGRMESQSRDPSNKSIWFSKLETFLLTGPFVRLLVLCEGDMVGVWRWEGGE